MQIDSMLNLNKMSKKSENLKYLAMEIGAYGAVLVSTIALGTYVQLGNPFTRATNGEQSAPSHETDTAPTPKPPEFILADYPIDPP